jgi:hypothetical protein
MIVTCLVGLLSRDHEVKGLSLDPRYRMTKIDCLRFVMCLLLVPVFQGRLILLFLMRPLTVLMRETRLAVCVIHQSILLRCLWSGLKKWWKGREK